jgi:hypothetical protein
MVKIKKLIKKTDIPGFIKPDETVSRVKWVKIFENSQEFLVI